MLLAPGPTQHPSLKNIKFSMLVANTGVLIQEGLELVIFLQINFMNPASLEGAISVRIEPSRLEG